MFTFSKISKISSVLSPFLANPNKYRFSTFSPSLQNIAYSDVIKLYEDQNGPFLNLPGRTISIDTTQSLHYFKEVAKLQYQDIKSVRIFDEKFVEISDTAPAAFLLLDDFLLKVNEEWYSIIVDTEDPILSFRNDYTTNDKAIYNLCKTAGHTIRQTKTLSKLISSLARDLSDHSHAQVDSNIVKTILEKNIYERSIEAKASTEHIDLKLSFLKKKLADLEEVKGSVEEKLSLKARKRLRNFLAFIFAQILAIQYGTYVAFSWDVMEPITNLLGIMDVIIAYGFWMATNKSYSFENIGKNYIESRKDKQFRKIEFDIEEYEEVKKLISYLETQKFLLSPKVEDLLQAIQLLDKKQEGKRDDEEEEEE